MENAEERPPSRTRAGSRENLRRQQNTEERPSSESSARGQSSSELLRVQPQSEERPSSKSSLRGQNSGNAGTQPDEQQPSGATRDGPRKSSRLVAPPATSEENLVQIARGVQKATGDSLRGKSGKQGIQMSSSARRSQRITVTAVQSVSAKLNMLNISRQSEGAQQQPKVSTAGRAKSIPASASRRSTTSDGGISAQNLVLSAMGDLKSRKGVSLAAIDRHISAKLGAQAAHWRPYVRVFLRKAMNSGHLVHVTGKGLLGSFKEAQTVRTKAGGAKKEKTNKSKNVEGTKRADRRKKLLKKPADQQRQQTALRQK